MNGLRRLLARFSTSTVVGLAFIIPAMLSAGLLLAYHALGARRYVADEAVRYGEIVSGQILSSSQSFLRLGALSAIQETIETTGSTRPFVHLALIGGDGKVIASNKLAWIGRDDGVIPEPAYRDVAASARGSFRSQHRLVDDSRRLVMVSPVVVQGSGPILSNSHMPILYLKLDQTARLREIYVGILKRGLVSAFGILATSLFLFLWVRASLARPIEQVASYLREFAAGSKEPPPEIAGPREVEQLIADVGRMAHDLREKQAALSASEDRHRRLLEEAYEAIVTADPESGKLLEFNRMFCTLFGYSPEEARELTLRDLHPSEDGPRRMADYAPPANAVAADRGHRDLQEIVCVRKGGGRFPVDIRGGPISLGHRTVTEWVFRDTTERRALEEHVRQSHKMTSVANLAGGIAHDFNNLLTGILGYTRLIIDRLKPDEPSRKQMEIIERSALRAADLTAQLLMFSQRAESRPKPGDLNQVLSAAIEELRPELPAGVELEVRLAPGLWIAAIDARQVVQVLLRLCANAREAMPEGGRLTIETGNRVVSVDECRVNLEARPGRFVTLAIHDTGRGIAPEIRNRLFEPFFTTKKSAKAAGLGLATVYGAVKGHQGWVVVSSEPGRGSSFVVLLPAWEGAEVLESAGRSAPCDAGTQPAAPPRVRPVAPPRAEKPPRAKPAFRVEVPRRVEVAPGVTILAVDDESSILALTRDVLELHGYRVLTARNGEEALRVFKANAAAIGLVVMDLTMPAMGGLECFQKMQAIDPHVRVVISSGFSSESSAGDVLRQGACDYLQKPFDLDHLATVVRRALGPRADPPGGLGAAGLSGN